MVLSSHDSVATQYFHNLSNSFSHGSALLFTGHYSFSRRHLPLCPRACSRRWCPKNDLHAWAVIHVYYTTLKILMPPREKKFQTAASWKFVTHIGQRGTLEVCVYKELTQHRMKSSHLGQRREVGEFCDFPRSSLSAHFMSPGSRCSFPRHIYQRSLFTSAIFLKTVSTDLTYIFPNLRSTSRNCPGTLQVFVAAFAWLRQKNIVACLHSMHACTKIKGSQLHSKHTITWSCSTWPSQRITVLSSFLTKWWTIFPSFVHMPSNAMKCDFPRHSV